MVAFSLPPESDMYLFQPNILMIHTDMNKKISTVVTTVNQTGVFLAKDSNVPQRKISDVLILSKYLLQLS